MNRTYEGNRQAYEIVSGFLVKRCIAAIFPSEFCIDENASFWINGIPIVQKNIEKYPDNNLNQSICQSLKPDELLVLGDHPNSYDSRYFGPIKKSDVIASVKLIWAFE